MRQATTAIDVPRRRGADVTRLPVAAGARPDDARGAPRHFAV